MDLDYGWENSLESIWMNHFNKQMLNKGIINQDEYRRLQVMIAKDSLNLDVLRGTMTTSV